MSSSDIPDWAADIAKSILLTVKAKDEYTFQHCVRVGRAARMLGQAMSLTEFEQAVLEFSGLFHDIGKVGIPDSVLLKPAKLDPGEVEIMKSHPSKSADIIEAVSHIPFFRFLLPGVKYHHERIDGLGYPYNLVGEKIPLMARVIAVVDTVDAMTHARPYRNALPLEKAKQELKDFSGTQFDGNLVKIYLESIAHKKDFNDHEHKEVIIPELIKIVKAA